MKWSQILAALKAVGYTGPGRDLEKVKAFVEAEGLELIVGEKKLTADGLDMAFGAKTVYITSDAGEDVQIVEPPAEEPAPAAPAEPASTESASPKSGAGKGARRHSTDSERAVSTAHATGGGRIDKHARAYANKIKNWGVGGGERQAVFSDPELAETFGAWVRKSLFGPWDYPQKSRDSEILTKTSLIGDVTAGGSFVPDEFHADLIEIFLEYGVARQVCGVTSMARDTGIWPRLTTDVTTTWTGEATANTATDPATDGVQLTCQKMMSVSNVSSELMSDSAISMADTIARSIARSQAQKEDNAFFNGTGASTYGGFKGVVPALSGLAGLTTGTGDLWPELTLDDINLMMSKYYQWSGASSPKFVCHSAFFWNVMAKFMDRVGAVTTPSRGSRDPSQAIPQQFFGYPVVFSNVMNSDSSTSGTSARGTVPLLFGDFSLGAKFGERAGGLEIATSEHVSFTSDLIAIRGKNRVAINVHDVGDASTPGPIVGLIMASS